MFLIKNNIQLFEGFDFELEVPFFQHVPMSTLSVKSCMHAQAACTNGCHEIKKRKGGVFFSFLKYKYHVLIR